MEPLNLQEGAPRGKGCLMFCMRTLWMTFRKDYRPPATPSHQQKNNFNQQVSPDNADKNDQHSPKEGMSKDIGLVAGTNKQGCTTRKNKLSKKRRDALMKKKKLLLDQVEQFQGIDESEQLG